MMINWCTTGWWLTMFLTVRSLAANTIVGRRFTSIVLYIFFNFKSRWYVLAKHIFKGWRMEYRTGGKREYIEVIQQNLQEYTRRSIVEENSKKREHTSELWIWPFSKIFLITSSSFFVPKASSSEPFEAVSRIPCAPCLWWYRANSFVSKIRLFQIVNLFLTFGIELSSWY